MKIPQTLRKEHIVSEIKQKCAPVPWYPLSNTGVRELSTFDLTHHWGLTPMSANPMKYKYLLSIYLFESS